MTQLCVGSARVGASCGPLSSAASAASSAWVEATSATAAKATGEGLAVMGIAEAAAWCDLMMFTMPDELQAETRDWFAHDVAHHLRPGAQSALDEHRRKGHTLVLLTSASAFAAATRSASTWKPAKSARRRACSSSCSPPMVQT